MSDVKEIKEIDPRDLLTSVPDLKVRAAFVGLAIAAIAFPVIKGSAMGFGGSMFIGGRMGLGALSYVLPLGFVAAAVVATVDQLKPWRKIADMAAAVVSALIAAWILVAFMHAFSMASDVQSSFDAWGGSRSSRSLISVMPGLGAVALGILAAWSCRRAFLPPKAKTEADGPSRLDIRRYSKKQLIVAAVVAAGLFLVLS